MGWKLDLPIAHTWRASIILPPMRILCSVRVRRDLHPPTGQHDLPQALVAHYGQHQLPPSSATLLSKRRHLPAFQPPLRNCFFTPRRSGAADRHPGFLLRNPATWLIFLIPCNQSIADPAPSSTCPSADVHEIVRSSKPSIPETGL
jgi:hypothetical protein